MRLSSLCLIVCVAFLVGCGSANYAPVESRKDKDKDKAKAASNEVDHLGHAHDGSEFVFFKDKDKDKGGDEGKGRVPLAVPPLPKRQESRKIIYTGQVDLIVEDFDKAAATMIEQLEALDGYEAGSDITGTPGVSRQGTWTLRIPVAKFRDFLRALVKLGELEHQRLDSEDVTDRYFDTKAEMTNLEAREEALRKLYKEKVAGSKLGDLLEVDRELSNVRSEINVRKGRLQRWDKLSAFATIIVRLHERKGYIPPESPRYPTRLGRSFSSSIEALVETGKALLLGTVVFAPWLAVLGLIGAAVWVPVRRYRNRQPAAPSPPPAQG
jgi:hypothetical protein